MTRRLTLRNWIKAFDRGEYESPDYTTQCKAGWFDWFCDEKLLAGKTRKLGKLLKTIAESPKIDKDKTYVFFKNNCPMAGKLYDDFRICDRETGNVLFTVVPRSGFDIDYGASSVYVPGSNDGFVVKAGTWKDVKKFFGVK